MDTIETTNVIRCISAKSSNLLELYSPDPNDPSVIYLSPSFDNLSHFSPFQIIDNEYSFRSPRKCNDGEGEKKDVRIFSYLKWPNVLLKYTKKDYKHDQIIAYSNNPYALLSMEDNIILEEFKIDEKSLKCHLAEQDWAPIEGFFEPFITQESFKTTPILSSDWYTNLKEKHHELAEPQNNVIPPTTPNLLSDISKDFINSPNNIATLKNEAKLECEDYENVNLSLSMETIDESVASDDCGNNSDENDTFPISGEPSDESFKNDSTTGDSDEDYRILLPAEASKATIDKYANETMPVLASINTKIQSRLPSAMSGGIPTNTPILTPPNNNSVDIQLLISVITNLISLCLTHSSLLEKLQALLEKPSVPKQLAGKNVTSTVLKEDEHLKMQNKESTFKCNSDFKQNLINCKNKSDANESNCASYINILEDSQENFTNKMTQFSNKDLYNLKSKLIKKLSSIETYMENDVYDIYPARNYNIITEIINQEKKGSLLGNINSLLLDQIDPFSPVPESFVKKNSNKSEFKNLKSFDFSPPPPPPPRPKSSKTKTSTKKKKKKDKKRKDKNKNKRRKNKNKKEEEKDKNNKTDKKKSKKRGKKKIKAKNNNNYSSDSPPSQPPPLVPLSPTVQSHNHLYRPLIVSQHDLLRDTNLSCTLNLHDLNNIPIPDN